jgi:hypothetical protein
MKAVALAVLVLVVLTLPSTILAAKPAPAWPTAQDLQQDPGVLHRDAVCMARYYHGRLSRKAWFTHYWDLTAAQKLATDAGPEHCLTLAQRIAWAERFYTAIAGKLPQVHCAAVRSEVQTRAQHLAVTSYAKWLRLYDGIFRACRLTGAVYGEVAADKLHLPTTAAERSCANRFGSAVLMMYKSSETTTMLRTKVGRVYDRCVGSNSEQAMYRYVYRKYALPSKIPCIARRMAAALTIVEYTTDGDAVNTSFHKAVQACLASG